MGKLISIQTYNTLSKQLRQFYFGDKLITEETLPQFIDLMSDAYFVYPNYKSIELHQKNAKAYYVR